MKACNFTKIEYWHESFSRNLQNSFPALQNICKQLLVKHANHYLLSFKLFHSHLCALIDEKTCKQNKYHDKNIAAYVHIQSNQKLNIYIFLWFLCLCIQTWCFDKIIWDITSSNIWKLVNIFLPFFSSQSLWIRYL